MVVFTILNSRFYLHPGLLTSPSLSDLQNTINNMWEKETEWHKYSLTMAALLVSFRKRNSFSFFTRSSSTSHTTSDSLWWWQGKHVNTSLQIQIHAQKASFFFSFTFRFLLSYIVNEPKSWTLDLRLKTPHLSKLIYLIFVIFCTTNVCSSAQCICMRKRLLTSITSLCSGQLLSYVSSIMRGNSNMIIWCLCSAEQHKDNRAYLLKPPAERSSFLTPISLNKSCPPPCR